MGKRSKTKNKPSQQTPSGTLPDLQQALLDPKAENRELAAENAALKEQIASKELSWEQEKKKLLDEKDSLVSTLFMARNDLDSLVKTVESERANAKDHFEEIERKLTEQQVQKVKEMKRIFEKSVIDINTERERQWDTRLEEAAAEKASQIIQEKDDKITSLRNEMMALVERNLAMLRVIETEFQTSETEWQTKHEALEDRLGCELAAKEESFRKTQELQEHSREVEESWLAKEEEWLNKASKFEEDIKLLIVQNIELQELALKTDKEKATMKKEEKRAKKETEERLEKERKEKEEREKKEKEEHEKKEKERLKREKKENEEREKEEKKERKEREMREKKENEERQKEEKKERKKRFKKEKKENDDREKEKKRERKEREKRQKKEMDGTERLLSFFPPL